MEDDKDKEKLKTLKKLIAEMNDEQIDQLLLITYEMLKNKRP